MLSSHYSLLPKLTCHNNLYTLYPWSHKTKWLRYQKGSANVALEAARNGESVQIYSLWILQREMENQCKFIHCESWTNVVACHKQTIDSKTILVKFSFSWRSFFCWAASLKLSNPIKKC